MRENVQLKISGNIHIGLANQGGYQNLPPHYAEHYILNDKKRDREFLVNSSVKYFMDKFSNPTTAQEVINEVMAEVKDNSAELEKTCTDFIKFLWKKKVVVYADEVEKEIKETTLFNTGEMVGRYCIIKTLSIRDYVDIYLAEDQVDQQQYVIKLLDKSKTDDDELYNEELEELDREYMLLKRVTGEPSICQAYDFVKQPQFAYLVLEYIDGLSVSGFLKKYPKISRNESLNLMKQVLMAFARLHQNKLVHGDIHSSNVLITPDKKVKIIDLGLSLQTDVEEGDLVKIGGVDFYMPPERIYITSVRKHAEEPNLYSDVYQIGILFYLMLYNTTPFTGFTWEELANNIKTQQPRFAARSAFNFTVSKKLVTIIENCLQKEPLKRYESSSAILADFDTIRPTESVLTVN